MYSYNSAIFKTADKTISETDDVLADYVNSALSAENTKDLHYKMKGARDQAERSERYLCFLSFFFWGGEMVGAYLIVPACLVVMSE